MLTKDTLELIIDQAAAANSIPPTNVPVAVLPAGVKIHSLEQFQQNRSRFRGALHTNSLQDFSQYTINRNAPTAKGFVDAEEMSCKIFFNLGDDSNPGHADDTAKLTLLPTAAYKALRSISGRKMNQRELAEWIEDWNANLRAKKEGNQDMDIHQAINSVRNITMEAKASSSHAEHNFGASRSAMDSIEAASSDTRLDALFFTFIPYEGLQMQTFQLKLSILTGDDKPTLKLRWVGEELQVEDIAQEFKKVLAGEVGGHATLTLGTFTA